MNRRHFMKTAAGTTAAMAMAPGSASSSQNVLGANDRVNVALIGCGGRGRLVAGHMAKVPNVAFVAVCDISDTTIAQARTSAFAAPEAEGYKDFRRALDRKDVHAVLIATPDHWHAIPTVLACQAGKDIYVEKPLGHNVVEGRKMVEAARKHNRIVQHGTQHRSAPHYKEIEKIIQSGEIGDVHFVRVWNYGGNVAGQQIPDSEIPEGVDWDMYLGPAPMVPFNRQRFQGTYRRFFDYAGGYITDFGCHRLDSVHQVMHDDTPLTVYSMGSLYVPVGQGDTPDVLQVTYEYKNWVLSYEGIQMNSFGTGPRMPGGRVPYNAAGAFARPHGEAFYGTKGTIFSDRVGYELFPADGGGSRRGGAGGGENGDEAAPKSAEGRDCTDLHAANFIEAVRSRQKPVADIEIGHKSSNVCHLGNISYRLGGRKLKWNAEKDEIVGDQEASKMLWREPRAKWDLI
ncbi:MAG: Gfo/Idh/MocA family oxidoreductase [Acidobacteria bacterium]|nr:Gfo/Idh/MocA family oxidoreductase [Acidobacteriota bacterium]